MEGRAMTWKNDVDGKQDQCHTGSAVEAQGPIIMVIMVAGGREWDGGASSPITRTEYRRSVKTGVEVVAWSEGMTKRRSRVIKRKGADRRKQ